MIKIIDKVVVEAKKGRLTLLIPGHWDGTSLENFHDSHAIELKKLKKRSLTARTTRLRATKGLKFAFTLAGKDYLLVQGQADKDSQGDEIKVQRFNPRHMELFISVKGRWAKLSKEDFIVCAPTKKVKL